LKRTYGATARIDHRRNGALRQYSKKKFGGGGGGCWGWMARPGRETGKKKGKVSDLPCASSSKGTGDEANGRQEDQWNYIEGGGIEEEKKRGQPSCPSARSENEKKTV